MLGLSPGPEAWNSNSTPPYAFMAWDLVKNRGNFTFTFTFIFIGK